MQVPNSKKKKKKNYLTQLFLIILLINYASGIASKDYLFCRNPILTGKEKHVGVIYLY